jgi:hypothetical protein
MRTDPVTVELRCPNGIKFGELIDGLIEVKCRSNRCGAGAGVIVLHRFDPLTGELVDTKRFREVAPSIGGGLNGSEHNPASVRVA